MFTVKTIVSNLKIDNLNRSNCVVTIGVNNLYNSPITAIGANVNECNYDYSNLTIPSGETQDETLAIKNLVITSSPNYTIALTFTFGNVEYDVYSKTILPVRYVGSAFITQESLLVAANTTILSVTFQNTGNIPIKEIRFTTDSHESGLLTSSTFNPDEEKTFSKQLSSDYEVGNKYAFEFQVVFIEKAHSRLRLQYPP
jgi:hypothetical protein